MALKLLQRNGTWYVRGTCCGISVYETTRLSDRALAEEIRAKRERQIIEGRVQALDIAACLPGEEVGHLTSLLIAELRQVDQAERDKVIKYVIRRLLDEA